MEKNTILYCGNCGSDKIELINRYPNHIHAFTTKEAKCTNCGYPSSALSFLSYGKALDDYVESFSKIYPIHCSTDEIKKRVVENVKNQIVQSCLFDEKDNIITRKDGYYIFK